MPQDPIIAVAKVLPRGAVQLSPEVMERLRLKPGTKLILATTGDAVVIDPLSRDSTHLRKFSSSVMW